MGVPHLMTLPGDAGQQDSRTDLGLNQVARGHKGEIWELESGGKGAHVGRNDERVQCGSELWQSGGTPNLHRKAMLSD